MRGRICLATALLALTAFGYLKSYEVTPTQASWSGWTGTTPGQDWVGNTFTANFDSITEVQVFVGYLGASPSTPFEIEVRDYATNDLVAYNDGVAADRDHSWVKFPMTTPSGTKFVRGNQHLSQVTRLGPDAGLDFGHSQSIVS